MQHRRVAALATVMLVARLAAAPVEAATSGAIAPEARRLLQAERVGTLSTRSLELPGFPFGSLTPYALDAQGWPLVLLSTLAQHTKNLQADPRVSLLVYDTRATDLHDAARLTWLGRAVAVPATETAPRETYLRRFPEAKRFFEAHDFSLYRLEPVRGYYIGGFGRIFWLTPEELTAPAAR